MKKEVECRIFPVFNPRSNRGMDTAKFGQWSFVILRTPRIHEHLTPDSRVWIAARKESTSSKEKDYLHLLHTLHFTV